MIIGGGALQLGHYDPGHISAETDAFELSRWCRAVGAPVFVAQPAVAAPYAPPALSELVVVSWNAHLAEGELYDLIAKLKSGALTDHAIISTEPLLNPLALELPLARQRRVALGAAVTVQTEQGPRHLQVLDAHLEPLSSPKTLWLFKNPRGRQVQAILDLLATPHFTDASVAGVVLGGDFNTVRSGDGESAYRLARAWSAGMVREDDRNTHLMGRLDYLFFRLGDGWSASTRRLDERFGSDHYPVLGTFSR